MKQVSKDFGQETLKKKGDCRLFLAFPFPSAAIRGAFPGTVRRLRRCCTYGHVRFASCIDRFSDGVYKVATDSKIAHLHLAQSIDQHVGRLDIWNKNKQEPVTRGCCGHSFLCHQRARNLHLSFAVASPCPA